jgi:hypothetical protein
MRATSGVIRVTTGLLNTVNDAYVGGQPAGSLGLTDVPGMYPGQLGKREEWTQDEIAQMFDSSVGTLYGAWYRYVRMRAADDDSPAITPGKLVFWDTTVTNWQTAYQVTRDENLSSSDNAVMIAGVYIGGIEGGNYGFICDEGLVAVRFRAVLTAAGANGCRVYAAGTGDVGDDQGTADVLTTDSTSLANARYLGTAPTTPVGGALANVILKLPNYIS